LLKELNTSTSLKDFNLGVHLLETKPKPEQCLEKGPTRFMRYTYSIQDGPAYYHKEWSHNFFNQGYLEAY